MGHRSQLSLFTGTAGAGGRERRRDGSGCRDISRGDWHTARDSPKKAPASCVGRISRKFRIARPCSRARLQARNLSPCGAVSGERPGPGHSNLFHTRAANTTAFAPIYDRESRLLRCGGSARGECCQYAVRGRNGRLTGTATSRICLDENCSTCGMLHAARAVCDPQHHHGRYGTE